MAMTVILLLSRKLRLAIPAICVALCSCTQTPLEGQENAVNRTIAIAEEIKTWGAKATVDRLSSLNSEKEWEEIKNGIQTGKPAWLLAARELRLGSDSGMTEDIDVSLAIALTNNAEGVLELVGASIPSDGICTVPYIEPDAATVVSHKRKAKAALEKVSRPDLVAKRDTCLAAIEKVK